MKLKTIFLFILTFFQSYSQVSVSSQHFGKLRNFEKDVLEKFKNTETIFLLSNIYDISEYDKILKESWTVTPYRIVDPKNFEIENYISDKYSIVQLAGLKRVVQKKTITTTSIFTYFDLKIYDSATIFEALNKLSPKKRAKKRNDIINEHSSNIARFYIFPKDDFIHTSLSEEIDTITNSLYNDDVFFNYKLGFIKNYFQKINSLLDEEKIYWMYEKDFLPELKQLANKTLYIPSYMTIKYNGWSWKDSEKDNENVDKIFNNYDYKYEIIADDELNDKILNNEELYYLRYVRMNTERFLQVVNSKTGEIIYRDYITGLSYKIKSKHIDELNDKIKEALKN